MRRHLAVALVAAATIALIPAAANAQIRLENKSKVTLWVYLMKEGETNYRPAIQIEPGETRQAPITAGRYFVATGRADGSFAYLNWQNYSNHRLSYNIARCFACAAPATSSKPKQKPMLMTTTVHHKVQANSDENSNVTSTWAPGWENGDVAQGRVNADGDNLVDLFDYRLGFSFVDFSDGVLVTQTIENTPSQQLELLGPMPSSQCFALTAGKAVIKSINGQRVRNTSDFLKALEHSPSQVEMDVSSLKGEVLMKLRANIQP